MKDAPISDRDLQTLRDSLEWWRTVCNSGAFSLDAEIGRRLLARLDAAESVTNSAGPWSYDANTGAISSFDATIAIVKQGNPEHHKNAAMIAAAPLLCEWSEETAKLCAKLLAERGEATQSEAATLMQMQTAIAIAKATA